MEYLCAALVAQAVVEVERLHVDRSEGRGQLEGLK